MPQIEHRMISNQLQSSVFLYTCQSADGMEIIKKSPSKNGSLSNGVDDLKNLTSEMEWSFLFPSYSPVFFQIGTVTYQHHLRFLKLSRFLNPKQLRFRLLILRFIPSTGPLEKSYSTLLRTAVMFFFKVEIAVSMF